MHLETVSEFKRMQSKKDIGYTYFRFEKNAHKELVDRSVAAFEIDGAFLLIPFAKSRAKSKNQVITDQMKLIYQRLNEVVLSLKLQNEVITRNQQQIKLENENGSAKGRIRTGEPLQERILSPSRLA